MKSFFETLFRVGGLCLLVSIPVFGFACLSASYEVQVWANDITFASTWKALRGIYGGLVFSFPVGCFAIAFWVNRKLPKSSSRHSNLNAFGVVVAYTIFLTIPFAYLAVFHQPHDGFLLTAGAIVGYALGMGLQFLRRQISVRNNHESNFD
ncbi:hypothetical protein [Mariniblastus fucicola]|uniref:Lipoprotein n=1 Tax=Mariniblastus fucicola TaxID=980251 RepID=A0A5B9PJN6_9BACT|nr:hypothetical protein [Mariniblastus fucicola]QEG22723.1 hypothetical protein MFFC18_26060 [Mariniblastus fucicola]